ncbi:MarR family winged helix-turn-helix transcriptional regulator [Microbacterium deminutum]|uniref:MarR family transcriptional regulator TamR n=1 Tax=Microbacterium deminutum TaxID=344164 RepID=A0ABN2RLX7_9MICO
MSGQDDEVDLLIDAWARRLPDVDLSPLDVMSRLRRVALKLGRIRAAAFATAGLAAWEFDVLAALRRAEPPHQLNPAQLIQLTSIGSAAMTNRLTNLVDRGLIEREANPRDGRGVLVKPTADGIARVDAAMGELVRREEIALSRLSAQDRIALVRTLRALLE